MPKPTINDIREQFDYDPETGELFRKNLRAMNLRPETGSLSRDGYMIAGINGGHQLVHRVAWAHFHGDWPSKQIEHINKDKTDNRIANLRLRNPSPKRELTVDRLKELLRYESETGKFFWLKTTRVTRADGEAGSVRVIGYRGITIDGVTYYAHRLAWLYVNSEWPKRNIDHRNGDRDDNRIENLADVTSSQNSHNTMRLGPNNSTGFRGVARYRDKFISQGSFEGKAYAFTMRDTPEEAYEDYKKRYIEHFGKLPENTNVIGYPRKSRAKGDN